MANSRVSTLTVRLLDDVSKPARTVAEALKEAERRVKDVGKAMSNTGATDRFQKSLAGLKLSAKDIGTVKDAWTAYARSANLAGDATKWTKTQTAGVRAWERQTVAALRNVTREQQAFARSAANTGNAPTAWQTRRGAAGALVGGYAASRAGQVGKTAAEAVADFDMALRQQKVFMDLQKEQQDKLKAQALRIGQDTKFTNLDVVHAQTAAMQGMGAKATPTQKAETAIGITEAASNFAQMMPGTDLTQSAELIRSYMTAFGKDMSNVATAVADARDAANVMLKTAKAGGMSAEDVGQYVKFAGSAANAAGIKEQTAMALGAIARIGGLRGDEAGVFMRTAANKLTSPTNKGRAALAAAGINYDDYVARPDRIDKGGLEAHFRRRLGKGFDPKTSSAVDAVLADKSKFGDQASFVEAITKATENGFGQKTKKGTTRASDLNAIARTANEFYSVAGGKVDSERLLQDIMSGKMTYQQASAFFTDKHGGKAMISKQGWEEAQAIINKLVDVKNDPQFAERGAKEIQGGVGGEINRMKGSIETFYLKVGEANEGLIKFGATLTGATLDSFSNAGREVQLLGTAAGAATAAFGAWKAGGYLKDILTGGGASTALTGSAAALTGSAEALTAAALRLGAGGAVPMAPGGAGGAAATGAGATASNGGLLARGVGALRWGAYAGIAYASWKVFEDQQERQGIRFKGVKAGEEHNLARRQEAGGRRGVLTRGRSGDDARAAIDDMAGPVKPVIDSSDIERAIKQAGDAKSEVDGLNTTVRPNVDASGIDAFLLKVRQAKQELAGLGSGVAAATGRLGSLGRTQRGNFTFGGVRGE